MKDLARLSLRMADDGWIYLDVARFQIDEWEEPDSLQIGHARNLDLVLPDLMGQLEAFRERWEDGRERRIAEREQAQRDHLSLMREEWRSA